MLLEEETDHIKLFSYMYKICLWFSYCLFQKIILACFGCRYWVFVGFLRLACSEKTMETVNSFGYSFPLLLQLLPVLPG